MTSILALPIKDGPGVTGVIQLLNKRSGTEYQADEIEGAMKVCDLASRLVGVGIELRAAQDGDDAAQDGEA